MDPWDLPGDPSVCDPVRGSGLLKYFFSPEDVILNKEIRHVTSSLGTADPAVHVRWHNRIQQLAEQSRLGILVTVSSDPIGFAAIGDSLTEENVTCMTKHFPGGGPQEDGWNPHFKYGMNQVYPGNNFDYHLIPFRTVIRAGTAQMMP